MMGSQKTFDKRPFQKAYTATNLHKPTLGVGYVGLCRVCRLLGKVRFHLRFV
jgi:hypothetical protein